MKEFLFMKDPIYAFWRGIQTFPQLLGSALDTNS